MRRAIADSDDEEDDIAIQNGNCDVRAVLPNGDVRTNAEIAVESLDATDEKSTGSTEHLRRQIQSAERGLVSNSAPKVMDGQCQVSSASPSIQANKRRHSYVLGSETNLSTQRSVKRSKTVKTYGSRHQTSVTDDGSFERLQQDEATPKTSQSAKFTEHSDLNSSAALPSGSIQDGFLSHEPNVMFQDSGSTIADNSSAKQRLLEEALGMKSVVSPSVGGDVKLSDQQNSSIPWSTARENDITKSTARQGASHTHSTEEKSAGLDASTGSRRSSSHRTDQTPDEVSQSRQAHVHSNVSHSPTVEIRRDESHSITEVSETSKNTQKAHRGRKRKLQDDQDEDRLISDDQPVGLPKEEYKPRLSRRRATQIDEEPIDFSVRPEKAAKIKRTKTTNANGGRISVNADAEDSLSAARVTVSSIRAATDSRKGRVESVVGTALIESPPTQVPQEITDNLDSEKRKTEQETTQEDAVGQVTPEQKGEDEIDLGPPKAVRKPSPTSKTKRSHTTIFEDHVDFAESERAPNLSQRQADRKSALQPVQNEMKTSQRKCRTVVTDEDDDEEEDRLVKEAKVEQVDDLLSKKRGRGRPPKSTAKVQTEPVDKALKDDKDNEENRPEPVDVPKKAGRGRPPKVREASEAIGGSDNEEKMPSNSQTPKKELEKPTVDAETNGSDNASDPLDATLTSKKLPTPSPEHKHTSQKDLKPSPTSHSPIQSTTGVPIRVGLSKRHRIPPLLRLMKPPKR